MALEIEIIHRVVSQYPNPEFAQVIEIKRDKEKDTDSYWLSMSDQQTKTNKNGGKRVLLSRSHTIMLTKKEMQKLGEVLTNL